MVDAQAEVLLEAEHAVIPPREGLFRLREETEAVGQAEAEQALEGSAFRLGTEDLAGPALRVVHIAVVGGDVVVAAQGELRVFRQLLLQPDDQGIEPAQLVVVLVATDFLAVRHVGADDARAVDRAADQAFLLVGEMRVAANHIVNGLAGEQGDAVVGLLAREGDLVAGCLDLCLREIVVFQLQFLQAQHIGLGGGQPVEQVGQADLQRIDVPAGYFHLLNPPEGLLP